MGILSDEQLARVEADPVYQQILAAVGGEVPALEDADRARIALRFYLMLQSSLDWHTTCLNCANLLDRCYEADSRRERAEGELERINRFINSRPGFSDCYD
jgi:hypothetical protein